MLASFNICTRCSIEGATVLDHGGSHVGHLPGQGVRELSNCSSCIHTDYDQDGTMTQTRLVASPAAKEARGLKMLGIT